MTIQQIDGLMYALSWSSAVTGSGTSLVYNDTTIMDAKFSDYFAIYNMNTRPLTWGPAAVEILFHWCVNTYEAEIKDNILSMKEVQSHTEPHFGKVQSPPQSLVNISNSNVSYFTSPADLGFKYPIYGVEQNLMEDSFNHTWSGFTAGSSTNYYETGSDILLSASDNTLKQLQETAKEENVTLSDTEIREVWLSTMHKIAQNAATGLTNL